MAAATSKGATRDLAEILKDLGGIAPSRVRLMLPVGFTNEGDLIEFNARKEGICELVDGLLVEKAMGFNESDLTLALAGYLRAFIIPRNLGLVTGADGMMRLFPGWSASRTFHSPLGIGFLVGDDPRGPSPASPPTSPSKS